jgi:hypothetical protein
LKETDIHYSAFEEVKTNKHIEKITAFTITVSEELNNIVENIAKSAILTSFMLKCPTLEVLLPDIRCKSLAVSCENEDSEQQKYNFIYQESKAIKLILETRTRSIFK